MRILKYFTVLLLVMGVTACSDSGSSDDQQPPTVPDLQSVTPTSETDFFDSGNTGVEGSSATHAYDNATDIVELTVEPLFGMAETLAIPFIEQAQTAEPTQNNGVWEWVDSFSAQGQTLEIRLTASVDESTADVNWDLFLSSSGTDGIDFNDYNFMSGTSNPDGSQGSWQINSYDPSASSQAVYDFDWTKSGDNNVTAAFTINDPSSSDTFTLNFEEDGVEHTLTIQDNAGTINIEIFWNSDTNTGYIIIDGTKTCWDGTYQDTTCS